MVRVRKESRGLLHVLLTHKKKRQSTCLFSLDGLVILTDPVMDHKKRVKPYPCQIEDLMGVVNIVLVSHNHFDHLGMKKHNKRKVCL